jgi:GTPase Era involved in 16S rRNA processing
MVFFNYLDIYYKINLQAKRSIVHSFWCAVSRYNNNIYFMQCFFDTPGLMVNNRGYPYKDMKTRVESAWSSVDLYDVLMVIFDVHRHLTRLVSCCM